MAPSGGATDSWAPFVEKPANGGTSRRQLIKSLAGGVAGAAAASMLNVRPRVRRAYAASFDPVDFGAVGDGVHDDTLAINRAIQAAASAGGGIVKLPVGRFLIGSLSVQLASNVTLLGSGFDTLLSLAPGADASVIVSDSDEPRKPTVGSTIENLRIDGNKDNQVATESCTGVGLWTANDCVVRRVWVHNTAKTGVYVAGSRNRVEGCSISGIGLHREIGESGIVFDTDGVNPPSGSVAINNNVTNVLEHGIKVYPGGDGSVISGNQIRTTGNRGVYVQAAPYTEVSGNIVDGSGTTGILIGDSGTASDSCTVSSNVVSNSGSHGILVWGSSNVSVSNHNWVETNGGCGIYALDSPATSITGNICVGNNSNGGIVRNGSPNGETIGNQCVGNNLAGIYFWDQGNPSTGCLVDSNRCRDGGWGHQQYGILAEDGTTKLTITNNSFSGNLSRGMSLVGSNTVFNNS